MKLISTVQEGLILSLTAFGANKRLQLVSNNMTQLLEIYKYSNKHIELQGLVILGPENVVFSFFQANRL